VEPGFYSVAVDCEGGSNHSKKNQTNLVRIADISVHLKQTLKMHTEKNQFNLPEQLNIFGEIALTLENYKDKRELLRLLDNASHVCPACGEAFSNPRSSSAASLFATFHMGHCDVCKHHTSVTSTRDYGYLSAGIETLKLLLSKRQTSTKNKSDASIKNFLNMCSKRGI
jgi:hypothetical protein